MIEKKKKIKVAHIIYSLQTGGAERVAINYVKYLNRERFNSFICALKSSGPLEQELINNHIRYYILNKKSGIDPFILIKIIKILKNEKVDIVHLHNFSANIWGTLAAVLCGIKIIIRTEHTIRQESKFKKTVKNRMNDLMGGFQKKIIAVSNEVKKTHLQNGGLFKDRYITIHNGIEHRIFQSFGKHNAAFRQEFIIGKMDVVIGVVASLTEHKAHEIFIHALKKVIQDNFNICALIIGDGPRKAELKRLTEKLMLNHKIVFTGIRKDVPVLMDFIDIFCLPSDREGFPMTILEAMASSTPAVVTDVGGNKEAVINGKTGFLVPPRNIDAMANALKILIDNIELRKKMGQNSKKRLLQNFTSELMVKNTEKIYEHFVKSY